MTRKVSIDPICRIEGHMRIELDIQDGQVQEAHSAGTSFRGFEVLLVGRDPRDVPQITQRICGVCPVPHNRTACEAVEDAIGLTINEQARLIRNIVLASNFIESHLVHFYVLALPDYISGLPTAGAWPRGVPPRAWKETGSALQVEGFVKNQITSIQLRRKCHQIIGILAGKAPHATGILVGGATVSVDDATRSTLTALADEVKAFVKGPYADDLARIVDAYPEYETIGASGVSLLANGAFPTSDGGFLFPGGLVPAAGGTVASSDPAKIRESVASSLFERGTTLHPSSGVTRPDLGRDDAYSWIKAPRLDGKPCEVGPLARAVIGKRAPKERGVWARHQTRQAEAALLCDELGKWIAALKSNSSACPSFPKAMPNSSGASLGEAPRGFIGHWITITKGETSLYQVISPTTWNASPRDETNQPGPLEQALAGTRIADPEDPIEAMRVVHSFDPCVQCAVH